jgi:zinc/manganese transport system substrate-binding protein
MKFLIACLFFLHTSLFAQEKVSIVVSCSILADLVSQVCEGLDVHIQTLVPLDADPHVYEPKPGDLVLLNKAQVLILNGLGFEQNIEKVVKTSNFKGHMCYATKGITPRPDCQDPHAWHDVRHAIVYVENMTHTLKQALPHKAAVLEENAKRYIKQLNSLHEWILDQFSKIPSENRFVITTHDAFWYYGKAYGIQFLSPIGVSTEEQQPSAEKVRQLIHFIREKNIQVIFTENLSNSKQILQIAEETKIRADKTLYADSLSRKEEANSYIKMVRHNTARIVESLKTTFAT